MIAEPRTLIGHSWDQAVLIDDVLKPLKLKYLAYCDGANPNCNTGQGRLYLY